MKKFSIGDLIGVDTMIDSCGVCDEPREGYSNVAAKACKSIIIFHSLFL